MSNLEFPSKRYFGNRAETFVRVRRAQLEVCLKLQTSRFKLVQNTSKMAVLHSLKMDVQQFLSDSFLVLFRIQMILCRPRKMTMTVILIKLFYMIQLRKIDFHHTLKTFHNNKEVIRRELY